MVTRRIQPRERREPTSEENRASTILGRKLREVTYPDRARIISPSPTPPGRANMREVKRALHQQQMRVTQTAKPFQRVREEDAIETPLTVGFMCDQSASMTNAQETLGVVRWIFTDALDQVNAKIAAVMFGEKAHGIQRPGEKVPKVEIYEAPDGWENYVEGFSMIDGALNLIDGHGARLLVVITDGHFNKPSAVEWAEVTMAMCRRAGVAVIWLSVSGYFAREEDCYGHGTLVNAQGLSPVEVADLLGRAVIEEFRRAAPQHHLHRAS